MMMMMMMLMMHQGAEVVIWNPDGSRRSKSVLSSRDGEYWRVLVPGPPGNNTYTVQVIWYYLYFRRFCGNVRHILLSFSEYCVLRNFVDIVDRPGLKTATLEARAEFMSL